MVFTLDGNSDIGAHVWSEIGNLMICNECKTFEVYFQKKTCFPSRATCSELPYHIGTMTKDQDPANTRLIIAKRQQLRSRSLSVFRLKRKIAK